MQIKEIMWIFPICISYISPEFSCSWHRITVQYWILSTEYTVCSPATTVSDKYGCSILTIFSMCMLLTWFRVYCLAWNQLLKEDSLLSSLHTAVRHLSPASILQTNVVILSCTMLLSTTVHQLYASWLNHLWLSIRDVAYHLFKVRNAIGWEAMTVINKVGWTSFTV